MKIVQWGVYNLPDGVQVQATQDTTSGRWRFDTLDGQPLLIENHQRPGQLLLEDMTGSYRAEMR